MPNHLKRAANSEQFGKKAMRAATTRLREIARTSKMDQAAFDSLEYRWGGGDPVGRLPLTDENKVNDFIRARTRIWRNTWITEALLDLVEEMEDFYPEA
jgi:hypothetical protein